MGSNSFGKIFRITTWGESHGKAMGVVIDGCPAGIEISEEEINAALSLRAPGRNAFTSPRKESDQAEIYSGVFEGKTTGSPISILIPNRDAAPQSYEGLKNLLRPGHANYTYLEKYGVFDYRGGGRASARETVGRVAAGAVAKKLLQHSGISPMAYLKQIGEIIAMPDFSDEMVLRKTILASPLFCPELSASQLMESFLQKIREEGDSVGGIVEGYIPSLPVGLGDPVYEKIEANLANAMLSLPASKGFEIGIGFGTAHMKGSEHNDLFIKEDDSVSTRTNNSGGTLGGISNGMALYFRVAFKPTSSIKKSQETLTLEGEKTEFSLSQSARHDPCVAIRAVPVVEAMTALVLADALLRNRSARI